MRNKPQTYPLPESCPVCSGDCYIREIACRSCGTRIKGAFEIRQSSLVMDEELLEFLKVFIFAEGSIKQTEKILNCSYPKVKNLLKKTKAALGFSADAEDSAAGIIDKLDQGKIDVETALEKLKHS